MARKPTQTEVAAAQAVRDTNLDRDLKDIGRRLESIELNLNSMKLSELISKVSSNEMRIAKLENNQTSVVRLVLGTVGAALLATVIGVKLT